MPNHRKGDEYPQKSGILIVPKLNPSGSKAYRVDIPASITGTKREQRQFSTKDEAQRYARDRNDEITRFGHAAFALTARQRQDAMRAIEILRTHGLSLEDAATIAAAHVPTAKEKLTIAELRNRFLKAPGRKKTKVLQRKKLTLHNLEWRSARFVKNLGGCIASEVQTEQVRKWLSSLGPLSPVSLNNYRRVLHAMFGFGVAEGYCPTNPISKIPLFVIPEKAPSILPVETVERLIHAACDTDAGLGLLAYVTLGLFGGLRRAELERLDWSAVKWERRMVTIDGSIAKSGSIRNVALSENAMAWLSLCRGRTGSVAPKNLNYRLRRLRFVAGMASWDGNELRHSFASYHFDLHQNAPLTAAQLGHSSGCQLLFEHYRSLVPLGDGQKFFAIQPPAASAAPTLACEDKSA